MFNPITYFEDLQQKLKDTQDFYFAKVSGLSHLEQVITQLRKKSNFFAIDDIDDGMTFEGGGNTFYERRTYTVFILLRYGGHNDIDKRNEQMEKARTIYRKLLSKIIYDKVYKQSLYHLNTDNIKFNEFPGRILTGLTGIYFTISVDNPINLAYDSSEWTE